MLLGRDVHATLLSVRFADLSGRPQIPAARKILQKVQWLLHNRRSLCSLVWIESPLTEAFRFQDDLI